MNILLGYSHLKAMYLYLLHLQKSLHFVDFFIKNVNFNVYLQHMKYKYDI